MNIASSEKNSLGRNAVWNSGNMMK